MVRAREVLVQDTRRGVREKVVLVVYRQTLLSGSALKAAILQVS